MNTSSLPVDATLGDAAFDIAHGLIFDTLVQALGLPPEKFARAYGDIVKDVEADFRSEEQLMEACQCPDAALHRAQHGRILSCLHHGASALLQGNALPARRAVSALADWLPWHITTLDRRLLRAAREHELAGQTAA
jgi:hemerythrin